MKKPKKKKKKKNDKRKTTKKPVKMKKVTKKKVTRKKAVKKKTTKKKTVKRKTKKKAVKKPVKKRSKKQKVKKVVEKVLEPLKPVKKDPYLVDCPSCSHSYKLEKIVDEGDETECPNCLAPLVIVYNFDHFKVIPGKGDQEGDFDLEDFS